MLRVLEVISHRYSWAGPWRPTSGTSDPTLGNKERRAESLGSLDRLGREAPENDLEAGRAVDEVERSRKQPE